jgi:hypothetical protein
MTRQDDLLEDITLCIHKYTDWHYPDAEGLAKRILNTVHEQHPPSRTLPTTLFNEIAEKLDFAANQCQLWEDNDRDSAMAAIRFRALAIRLKTWMKKQ